MGTAVQTVVLSIKFTRVNSTIPPSQLIELITDYLKAENLENYFFLGAIIDGDMCH